MPDMERRIPLQAEVVMLRLMLHSANEAAAIYEAANKALIKQVAELAGEVVRLEQQHYTVFLNNLRDQFTILREEEFGARHVHE